MWHKKRQKKIRVKSYIKHCCITCRLKSSCVENLTLKLTSFSVKATSTTWTLLFQSHLHWFMFSSGFGIMRLKSMGPVISFQSPERMTASWSVLNWSMGASVVVDVDVNPRPNSSKFWSVKSFGRKLEGPLCLRCLLPKSLVGRVIGSML